MKLPFLQTGGSPLLRGKRSYDVAIIGMGTMGSFAAVELARRGYSVVGFDQFTPPHARGSHSGNTRVYRIAYPEGTGYVGLARRAGTLWGEAAERLGTQLLHRTGMLYMGPPAEKFLRQIAESAATNQLPMETLSAAEVSQRYPAFQIPENYAGLFDAQAGWIDVDASITSSHAYARGLGVECRFDQTVTGWEARSNEVRVHLANESVTAGHLIVTAGAWTDDMLRALELPLQLKRKVIAWFDPAHPELFAADRIPVFTFPDNSIYGFPNFPGLGVKLAEHEGGSYVPDAGGPIAPPGAEDLDPIAAAVARYMPKLAGSFREAQSRLVRSTTCLYTMTPDEDFLVDRHPQYSNVVFAAGFSGHGFKFAPLIAVALADLVLDGKTQLPIEFLSRNRLLAQFEQPNRSR